MIGRDEFLDLGAEGRVRPTGGFQKISARSAVAFETLGHNFLHALPAFDGHREGSLDNSRNSHAFALTQSRFTVAGETPTTSAVSSIDRPPKNRSSTILACCGSTLASVFMASSSASISISRRSGTPIASSSESLGAPDPRFSAWWARAWSTKDRKSVV